MPEFAGPITNYQLQSRLGRLPTELRLRIYRHVFKIENTVHGSTIISYQHSFRDPITFSHPHQRYRWTTPDTVLSLLETCRLFYKEAETYFYELNDIDLTKHRYKYPRSCVSGPADDNIDFWAWAEGLRMRRWYAIREMTVQVVSAEQGATLLRFVGCVPNLQTVTLLTSGDLAKDLMGQDPWDPVSRPASNDERSAFWLEVSGLKWERGIVVKTEESTGDYRFDGVDEFEERVAMV